MTPQGAKRVTVAALVFTGALAIANRVTAGAVPDVPRVLIGVVFGGAVLTFAADFAPDIAVSLALLALVAALVRNGPDVWTAFSIAAGAGPGKRVGPRGGARSAIATPSSSTGVSA